MPYVPKIRMTAKIKSALPERKDGRIPKRRKMLMGPNDKRRNGSVVVVC